jgi:hypothetical protein
MINILHPRISPQQNIRGFKIPMKIVYLVPGTYNPYTKSVECIPCPAGFFCPNSGMAATTDTISPGYYSKAGSSSATPTNLDGIRGECPIGYRYKS